MKCFIGIDLGSTTTKAVVMDEGSEVLGRGITNSRSNYDTAAAVSKQEALIGARFTLFHRGLEAVPALSGKVDDFLAALERHFRHVQIYRQGALAGSIITSDSKELPEDGRTTLESTRFSLREPEFNREVPTTLYMLAVCTNGQAPEPLRRPHLILDCDRQIYEEAADWYATLGPLIRMYHIHEQEMVQRQVQEMLQRSRVLRLAQKVKALNAKANNLLRRR
jgi:hypothetical protein